MREAPAFSIGIEEEYLLVDRESGARVLLAAPTMTAMYDQGI